MSRDDEIPRSRWARSKKLGSHAARLGLGHAGHLAGQALRGPKAREAASLAAKQRLASGVFEALAQLRGTALKVAQLLATEHELLPDELCTQLARATHRAPALNRALARAIFTREIGRPEQVFQHFESTPFAAASLGQVHAATAKGQRLAVKIQYPGMRETIDADLGLVAKLLGPSDYGANFRRQLPELRRRILEEIDYEKEASTCEDFADRLARRFDPQRLSLPRVYPEFSSKIVLTTQRIKGQHVQEFLAGNPAQKVRDRAGQQLVDLFLYSLRHMGMLHADPNFGNYLFGADGQVGMIDFGSVLTLSAPVQRTALKLFGADAPSDSEDQTELLEQLGVRRSEGPQSKAREAFIHRWFEWFSRPHRAEYFDFSASASYMAEGANIGQTSLHYMSDCEAHFIYLIRCHHGLLRLLEALRARVSFLNR